jgi:hypothetical protein
VPAADEGSANRIIRLARLFRTTCKDSRRSRGPGPGKRGSLPPSTAKARGRRGISALQVTITKKIIDVSSFTLISFTHSMQSYFSDLLRPAGALIKHAFLCALALLVFWSVFRLAHSLVSSSRLLTLLDTIEDVVLVAVFVYFSVVVLYDLMQERVRAACEFFRQLCSRHVVLA